MFSGIKIAVVLLVLSAAGGGFIYVKKLQSDLKQARLIMLNLNKAYKNKKQLLNNNLQI